MEAELKEELFGVWAPLHPELLLSFVNFSARKRKERERERERERKGRKLLRFLR